MSFLAKEMIQLPLFVQGIVLKSILKSNSLIIFFFLPLPPQTDHWKSQRKQQQNSLIGTSIETQQQSFWTPSCCIESVVRKQALVNGMEWLWLIHRFKFYLLRLDIMINNTFVVENHGIFHNSVAYHSSPILTQLELNSLASFHSLPPISSPLFLPPNKLTHPASPNLED